ncbi:MAG: hypothetical protein WBV55_08980, partial [Candidatus Sulfotelmatobacter sp.]
MECSDSQRDAGVTRYFGASMIPSFRQQFNDNFTPEKYQRFLRRIDEACGTRVKFRLSETPCFLPAQLLQQMAKDGKVLIRQLVESPEYLARSNSSIPGEYKVPNEPPHPMFVQVDFGLVRDENGELQPKLVELQAFPSLYAYQVTLAQNYIDVYGLRNMSASGFRPPASELKYFLSELNEASYRELLRTAIVGNHDPENVILMELDPEAQKTLPDFLMTGKMLGVRTVDIQAIKKHGTQLYYERDGGQVPIRRI